MLEGVWMPWGNRYTSRAFIDIDLIYSEFGVQNIFSSQERALIKKLKMHWATTSL